MQTIINKLDLREFLEYFKTFLSREKPFFIEGDMKLHYNFIKELSKYDFTPPPKISNLNKSLSHLKKFGILKLYEIYEFVKIMNYFEYLKKMRFEGKLLEWFLKIEIPEEINNIRKYFDEKGELKSEIDDDLLTIDTSLKRNKEALREALKRVINSKKISLYLADSQIHYINTEEALLLRGGFNHVIKGSVIGRSSAGFFYVVPENIRKLKDKEAEYLSKKEEIKYKYEKLISSTFTKFLKFLKYINKEFDRFDAYQARVFFAKSKELEFLLPTNKKEIIIKDFKHPALKDPKPVSVDFNKKILFVTGVNAGGKTMLLKSILSVAFLSKYLLPMKIDKHKSKIGNFKEIRAILDDPQNVKNDISTFAGRIVEFSKLFRINQALIGVDEIELGTDSDEAAVLFKVVLDELIKKDVRIVITTHHKKLSSMMASYDNVELYAALYDEKNRLPTYRFLKGTIGKSYAFETALRYGMPTGIIKKAKELYGEEQENLNELIQKNIDLELTLKEKIKELDKKQKDLQKERESISDIKEKSQKQLDDLIHSYESKYSQLMKELKESAKLTNSKDIHRSLNKINSIKKELKVKNVMPLQDFIVGDMVKYGNQKGKIISLKKDEVVLECDGIILRVPKIKLKKITIFKQRKKIKTNIKINKPKSSSIKIDLHGMYAQEAIEKLDKFISDALITGYDEVIISHGIGTGKLAYAVKEFLKTHPSVKSFDDAPISLGGYGATIVKF